MAEAVLHAHRRDAIGEPCAAGLGMGGVVGMAQLGDMHRADLVLAPAEYRGPRGIDAEKIAVEIRDAEQILGNAPDALALPRLLRDLGFQRVVELDQRLFARAQRRLRAHALGGLHHRGQHAADAAGGGLVRHRAVADGEARVLPVAAAALHPPRQVLREERRTPARENVLVERPELAVNLRPGLAQRLAQHGRVLVAKDRPVGIVVDQDELGAPANRLGKARRQHEPDRPFQRRRPAFRRPERSFGPVELAHAARHLAFALALGGTRRERRLPGRGGGRHHDRGRGRRGFQNGLHSFRTTNSRGFGAAAAPYRDAMLKKCLPAPEFEWAGAASRLPLAPGDPELGQLGVGAADHQK